MSTDGVAHHPGVVVLDRRDMAWLCLASMLLAAGVGASYAYIELSLNRMGQTATAIGANAAMPALAWLLATPLMPWALRRFPPRRLLLGLLAVAAVTILALPLWPDPVAWMGLRFVFGGATGMTFRLVEYWVGAASPETHRGRNVGLYSAAFAAGAMVGAGLAPLIGLAGWVPVVDISLVTILAALAFLRPRAGLPAVRTPPRLSPRRLLAGAAFLAVLCGLATGLAEAVPFSLMPVYAVRVGMGEDWAAWTASAYLAGSLVFPVPLGQAADRFGKARLVVLCAAAALVVPFVLPATVTQPPVLLALMVVWGGCGGSIYAIGLAMLADCFDDADLAGANAAFGTLYALGSLAGPLIHGQAMDWRDPQGLMVSAACLYVLFLAVAIWHSVRVGKGACRGGTNIPVD